MTNPSGIVPLDLRVLVKPDPVEEKSKGGIIIPDKTRDKEKFATVRARLIAAGPNAFKEWGTGNGPSPGDHVLVAQYAGSTIKGDDGEDYVIMNDGDICAVLTEPAAAMRLKPGEWQRVTSDELADRVARAQAVANV